ncbi:MAG TPA: RdgB/HAM1 family non-canonical purine NTP pyrophosphatase [Pyrinomonadaceae bacterium]|nr:RdgB/HAM1 family non-canonical purine NTP pyrophosphatase [Pyrinomonadaceae bacterium]
MRKIHSSNPERLLIASGNKGKIREFENLLAELPLELIDLERFPSALEPEENGATFAENAIIKAKAYASQTGEWAIADDSGLEIDALNGTPGVLSARFGGVETGYSDKMTMVLERMQNVDEKDRGARFVSVIAFAGPDAEIEFTVEGECRGIIALAPRGTNGFGYDPIFIPEKFDRTFGELTDLEKRSISHRGKASAEFIRKMLDFMGV